jgi:hypothetical protein
MKKEIAIIGILLLIIAMLVAGSVVPSLEPRELKVTTTLSCGGHPMYDTTAIKVGDSLTYLGNGCSAVIYTSEV